VKVRELITELEKLDPELRVLIAGDAEGNDYSELDGFDLAYVEPDYSGGRVEDIIYADDLEDDLEDEDDDISNYQSVLVFWPV
jgi:hypothetical protein